MHIATVTEKNPLGLEPGEYVTEDANAGQMLANDWASKLRPESNLKLSPDLKNARRVLFIRPGGFGDLLFLTPTLAAFKCQNIKQEIHVACFDRFAPVLENNAFVDKVIRYPVEMSEWGTYDAHVWLEGIIEKNPEALNKHTVDLIAERCGVTLTDKRMVYVVTDEEKAEAEKEFPRREGVPRVGVQMTASALCRIYPKMQEVAQSLWRDEGCEVFLFAEPGKIKGNEPEGIVNVSLRGKSFRESCAILKTCDCLVAPDSALVHVAGALLLPCVALYGPFPWTIRTAYAPATFAVQGLGPCAPCFHHPRPGKGNFPQHGPCRQTGKCEVLDSIPVKRVIAEVRKKIELRQNKAVTPYAREEIKKRFVKSYGH